VWTTIKDGRGRTYVMELPRPIIVQYSRATHVCRWFNHTTKDWVVSYSDSEGHQVGDSTYVYSANESYDEAEGLFTMSLNSPAA